MNTYKFLEMRVDKRGRKAMTQEELAEKLGLERNRIQQLETSPKVIPKDYELKAYCDFFNTTSDYLLGIRETKPVDENLAMINRTLGLSETSIRNLKAMHDGNLPDGMLETVNFILGNDLTSLTFFLQAIELYFDEGFDTPMHIENGECVPDECRYQTSIDGTIIDCIAIGKSS